LRRSSTYDFSGLFYNSNCSGYVASDPDIPGVSLFVYLIMAAVWDIPATLRVVSNKAVVFGAAINGTFVLAYASVGAADELEVTKGEVWCHC
jgi:hypothetical protein